jgi:hypothetical protein
MDTELIKSSLSYNPRTGEIFRTSSPQRRFNNMRADRANGRYKIVSVQGLRFSAHRLAWFLYYGYWPKEIDHINRDGFDNRINNLREVTRSENLRNRKTQSNNALAVKGVRKRGKSSYVAAINLPSGRVHIGSYKTEKEAVDSYNRCVKFFYG